jgi:hypothetical protein
LNTLHWDCVGGICTLSGRVTIEKSISDSYNIRAIAYKVVSPVLPGQINVFSACDVFRAYVERWHNAVVPYEFNEVLDDAKQLALNMKYLKTSSNFALLRLKKSCKRAVEIDANFEWFSACMLEASKQFISLLLQPSPEALHAKFSEYILSKAQKFKENELSNRTILPTNDSNVDDFTFTDIYPCTKNDVTADVLQYLVLGTQLGVLAGMRRAEKQGKFDAISFQSKQYFQFV